MGPSDVLKVYELTLLTDRSATFISYCASCWLLSVHAICVWAGALNRDLSGTFWLYQQNCIRFQFSLGNGVRLCAEVAAAELCQHQ